MNNIFQFALIVFCILFFWNCSTEDGSDYDQLSPAQKQMARGERIYKQYCRSCHGADGKMGLSGAKDLSQSELDISQRKMIISNGKNTMTPFKKILSEEEIEAVAQYTLTLSEVHE